VRSATAIEALETVDVLVFDKTGTLTEGRPKLSRIESSGKIPENELLELAASVERGSEHPLAQAILEAARARGITIPPAAEFQSLTGKGANAVVKGRKVAVGNRKLLEEMGGVVNPSAARAEQVAQREPWGRGPTAPGIELAALEKRAEALRSEGETVIFVAVDGRPEGLLSVVDPIRSTTPEAIRILHEEGLKLVMLTGDNRVTALAVARRLGIDRVEAEVLPEEKAIHIGELQREGAKVAMAGDGVNDAPALARADVGIAMGTGTDVAIESADVVLVKGDLRGSVRMLRLSRATMRNIRQNLFFAFLYNTLGVPIAAGVLYPFFGILLSPMIASAAMTVSSVSVIVNALRLRKLPL
jgi:Cu+-exporting ATPase